VSRATEDRLALVGNLASRADRTDAARALARDVGAADLIVFVRDPEVNSPQPLHVASDGIEALEVLRSGRMGDARRIVLLDLNMPRMNGIEFLRELRADPALRVTPVVVLTTSNDDRDRVEAYNLNVAGYLLKPVTFLDFAELMAALNRYWTLVELP
jgi:CheY-like chemotaxis protein